MQPAVKAAAVKMKNTRSQNVSGRFMQMPPQRPRDLRARLKLTRAIGREEAAAARAATISVN
jgi:hypothetical protein